MRLAAASLLLMTACQREPVESAGPAGQCRVTAAVSAMVGKAATAALVDDAKRLSGARTVRVIPPNTAVTMDYRTDRLNLRTNGRNVITQADCG